MKPRVWESFACSCPAMMPDRIGIMGNTHGVKASSSPKPKNAATDAHRPPSRKVAAMRLSSATSVRGAAADVDVGSALPPPSSAKVFVIGA